MRKVGVGRAMTQLPLRGRVSGSVGVSSSFRVGLLSTSLCIECLLVVVVETAKDCLLH